jgi:hypothetical protein
MHLLSMHLLCSVRGAWQVEVFGEQRDLAQRKLTETLTRTTAELETAMKLPPEECRNTIGKVISRLAIEITQTSMDEKAKEQLNRLLDELRALTGKLSDAEAQVVEEKKTSASARELQQTVTTLREEQSHVVRRVTTVASSKRERACTLTLTHTHTHSHGHSHSHSHSHGHGHSRSHSLRAHASVDTAALQWHNGTLRSCVRACVCVGVCSPCLRSERISPTRRSTCARGCRRHPTRASTVEVARSPHAEVPAHGSTRGLHPVPPRHAEAPARGRHPVRSPVPYRQQPPDQRVGPSPLTTSKG